MSSTRIPSLDGLRALSILLVLIGHFTYSAGSPIHHSWWTDTLAHHGVRIFFLISGFLITTLLLREQKKTGTVNLKQFYVRRAFRILPVAYIYLIAVTVVSYKSLTYRELGLAFTYLSSYVAHLPWSLRHLWSLSVEEQFYLLWPMAVAFGVALPRRCAIAAIAIAPLCRYVLAKNGLDFGAMFFFPSVADSLACGCLLALYQPQLQNYRSFFTWKGFPLIWAFTLSIPFLFNFLLPVAQSLLFWPLPQILDWSAITIFDFGMLLCMQNAILAPPRILNAAIPVWIGTLSYSLYIWQMPFANPHVQSWATTFPANLVLAWLAAVVSFYFVERPFLRLRERRATHVSSRSTCSPSSPTQPVSQKTAPLAILRKEWLLR